jgi:hypothetical protein
LSIEYGGQKQKTRLAALDFKADDKWLLWQCLEPDAPLHVDEHGLGIEIFVFRPARQPPLAPGCKYADQAGEFLARFGEFVLGAMRTFDTSDYASQGELLEPLGQHGSRYARDGAPDLIEPSAAGQQLAHD